MVKRTESLRPFSLMGEVEQRRQKLTPYVKDHIVKLVGLSSSEDPDMKLIIKCLRFAPYDSIVYILESNALGERALNSRVADELGSASRLNHWQPDSQEVKYMTGVLFQAHIERRITWLGQQLEAFKTGSRRYPTEELTLEHQREERATRARLKKINLTLTPNLKEIAAEEFLGRKNGKEYIEVLEYFARLSEYFIFPQPRNQIRRMASRFLRDGMVKEALDYITESLPNVG